MISIARVQPETFIVLNIEVATQEWLDEASKITGGDLLIPFTEENRAVIGLTWDPQTGLFEQPPTGPSFDGEDAIAEAEMIVKKAKRVRK